MLNILNLKKIQVSFTFTRFCQVVEIKKNFEWVCGKSCANILRNICTFCFIFSFSHFVMAKLIKSYHRKGFFRSTYFLEWLRNFNCNSPFVSGLIYNGTLNIFVWSNMHVFITCLVQNWLFLNKSRLHIYPLTKLLDK